MTHFFKKLSFVSFFSISKSTTKLLMAFLCLCAISSSAFAQQGTNITYKGWVTNVKGEAMPGVAIRVKNTTRGGFTDAQGKFSILAATKATLIFSHVGYKNKEVLVTSADADNIKVVLEDADAQTPEVVVTGYGNRKKSSFTGAQTSITKEQLLSVGTKSLLSSVEAFAPGIQILPDNNMGSNPNGMPEINIRGRGSFDGAANLPVFVVDGVTVPYSYVNDMNINDIEKVTILKDASATAIYGAKGSAGVIVITTKEPVGGKLRFNYDVTLRVSMPDLTDYHLLNAAQKLEYERLAGLYDYTGTLQYPYDELYNKRFQIVRSGVNTDWMSKPIQNSISQNHSFSMNGGEGKLRYSLGVRYGKENGVMIGSNRDRISASYRLTYNQSKTLTINNTSTISGTNSKESPYGSFSQYTKLNPYDVPKDSLGNYYTQLSYNMYNPLYESSLGSYNRSEGFNIMNTSDIQWWLNNNLRLDGTFSLRKNKDDSRRFVSAFSKDEITKADITSRGYLNESFTKGINYTGRLMLSYNQSIAPKTSLTLVGGANIESSKSENISYTSVGFLSDRLSSPAFASRYPTSGYPNGGDDISRSIGIFANANLVQNNKYFLDMTYRYEGSSKFGANQRFAPFWSMGAGWNVHNEAFMNEAKLKLLKLRGSIGYTGNQSFAPYQAVTTYAYSSLLNYGVGIGAVPITIGNPNLKWERSLKKNVGLDFTSNNDRFDFTLDVYHQTTDNLLIDYSRPPSVGVSKVKENLGSIVNKGVEFRTRVVPISKKSLYWALTLTASHNENRIRSISNALKTQNENNLKVTGTTPLPIYEEGQSTTSLKVVPSAGIDPATGNELYIKKDGQYTFIYDAHDKVFFGDQAATVFGALTSTLTYKKFYTTLSFGYSAGGVVYNQTLASRIEGSDPRYNADVRVFTDRWKQAGDVVKYKNIADKSIPNQSSRFVQINNYLTLRSLSLGYQFDTKVIEKYNLRMLRIEALTNDLFYWTTVKRERGLDYPFARSFELSLRVSF